MNRILDAIKKYGPRVIIAALLAILLLRECSSPERCPDALTDTIFTSDTIPGDSVIFETIIEKPVPVYRDTTIYAALPIDTFTDCRHLAREHFTRNKYDLVLKDDTSVYCRYSFAVYRNSVEGGRFEFQNRRPQVINTIITPTEQIKESKVKVFAGISIGRSMNEFALMPQARIQYNDFLMGAGYDLINSDVYLSLDYKISFRRKGARKR